MTLTAAYSTISGASIAATVDERYAIGPVARCRLFQRGYNDTYELDGANGRRYMARLSNRRFRGPANLAYETALVTHLGRSGIVVGVPIADREGRLWSLADAPEGPREFAVFERLTGREPFRALRRAGQPEAQALADFETLGASLAHIHLAGDSFQGPPSLYRIDAWDLLEAPLAQIVGVVDAELAEAARAFGQSLAAQLAARAPDLTVGHCHGDNHAGNTLIADAADGTPVAGWFDFDDAAPGFLAYDLATLLWQLLGGARAANLDDASRPFWSAFVAGYGRVRPIAPADFEAVGLFVPIRHILWVGNYASRVPLNGARVLASDWFGNELDLARKWDGLAVAD